MSSGSEPNSFDEDVGTMRFLKQEEWLRDEGPSGGKDIAEFYGRSTKEEFIKLAAKQRKSYLKDKLLFLIEYTLLVHNLYN
jgi:hypothetical protein